MQKRVEVYFSGIVQGVGFRFTTATLSKRFQVTGYVKNLSDGRVEVVAEGNDLELKNFIASITHSSLNPYIRNVELRKMDYRAEFTVFDIAF